MSKARRTYSQPCPFTIPSNELACGRPMHIATVEPNLPGPSDAVNTAPTNTPRRLYTASLDYINLATRSTGLNFDRVDHTREALFCRSIANCSSIFLNLTLDLFSERSHVHSYSQPGQSKVASKQGINGSACNG